MITEHDFTCAQNGSQEFFSHHCSYINFTRSCQGVGNGGKQELSFFSLSLTSLLWLPLESFLASYIEC